MTTGNFLGRVDLMRTNVEEILDRAATQNITEIELAILVSKTRELSIEREKELKRLQVLLNDLESRIDTH
ncbi:MAG: hypothetical protein ACI89U_000505 [Gammaproteobacteria bacterium]|jgi:hypothetical protein